MRFKAPSPLTSRPVRVCCVQYSLRPVSSFDAFAERVETYIDVGDDYDADLLLFPELLGCQLLGLQPRDLTPPVAVRRVAEDFAETFDGLFMDLARTYNRILVAGTFPRLQEGRLLNVASIFVPGHPPVHQPKLHLTPGERRTWGFEAGHELHVLETDFGKFGVAICYDIQFPEAARILCESGVELLLVPYLTDDRRGYTRVTTCARARAVENQVYVATAGMVGSLPLITDLTSQCAQSGIYTPCDFAFPTDGIATEAAPNAEMVVVADLDLAILERVRGSGSVMNHADAAKDGLHVSFDGSLEVHVLPWSEPHLEQA